MRVDEVTGRPVIVECRCEWPGGKSDSRRTCYTGPLPTPAEAIKGGTNVSWSHLNPAETSPEAFRKYPNQHPCCSYHTEFNYNHNRNTQREFITAHTKFHTYHLSAETFVDLVNDRITDGGFYPREFLRIRAISRAYGSPIDGNGTGMLFETLTGVDGRPIQGSEDRFIVYHQIVRQAVMGVCDLKIDHYS